MRRNYIDGSSNLDSINDGRLKNSKEEKIISSQEKFSNDRLKSKSRSKPIINTEEDLNNSIKRFTESEENIISQINELKKIATMKTEKILSLEELNNILPNQKNNTIDDEDLSSSYENVQRTTRLGEWALYKYMLRARR